MHRGSSEERRLWRVDLAVDQEERTRVSRRHDTGSKGHTPADEAVDDYEDSVESSHDPDRSAFTRTKTGDNRSAKRTSFLGKRSKLTRLESSEHEESVGTTRVGKVGSSVLPRAMKGKRILLIENELESIAEQILEEIEANHRETGSKPSGNRQRFKSSPPKPYELDREALVQIKQRLASVVSDIGLLKECQMVNVYNSLIGKKLIKIRQLLDGIGISEDIQEEAEDILESIDGLFSEAIKICSRLLVSSVSLK